MPLQAFEDALLSDESVSHLLTFKLQRHPFCDLRSPRSYAVSGRG